MPRTGIRASFNAEGAAWLTRFHSVVSALLLGEDFPCRTGCRFSAQERLSGSLYPAITCSRHRILRFYAVLQRNQRMLRTMISQRTTIYSLKKKLSRERLQKIFTRHLSCFVIILKSRKELQLFQERGIFMYFRAQQYYRINRHLKKAYHRLRRNGGSEEEARPIRETNAHIVELFAHGGLISSEWAAALGHRHEGEGQA